jgi:hypothetical protein
LAETKKERRVAVLMVQASIREGRAAQAATLVSQPAAVQAAEGRLPSVDMAALW